jgi:hypothetical protein
MESSVLPLLIKGYNSNPNGSSSTLPATAATIQWNNVLDSGRGDILCIDAIETGRPQFYISDTNAIATISCAGVQVISNANCGDFAPYSTPGNYYLTPLQQPGGQTLSLSLTGGGGSHGLQVLCFYQNRFATDDAWKKLRTSKLKRRWLDQTFNVTTNAKNVTSPQFTVPIAQGNVVGIELLAYAQTGAATSDIGLATGTVYVNGVTIFENVCVLYGHNTCTRPPIFPIKINPGDTYSFNVDASSCSAGVNIAFGVRIYFDDNNG